MGQNDGNNQNQPPLTSYQAQDLALKSRIAVALETLAATFAYLGTSMTKDKKIAVSVTGFVTTKTQQ